MNQAKWRLLYCIFLILSPIMILLPCEFALFLRYKYTGKLSNLPLHYSTGRLTAGYPKDHTEEYIKIALFGESAAYGWGTTGSDRMLKILLQENFPSKKFYIKNQADPARTFHRDQAEVMKGVVDRYDIFLVYAGHNEAFNWLDDNGYFRTTNFKSNKYRERPDRSAFIEKITFSLELHSYLYTYLMWKGPDLLEIFTEPRIPTNEIWTEIPKVNLFENRKALPEQEIENIAVHFREDLDEFCQLIKNKDKFLILSIGVPNYKFPPRFSVHRELSPGDFEEFRVNTANGIDLYNAGKYQESLERLRIANGIDDNAALTNFYLGRNYEKLGDLDTAWKYYRKSVDNDGLPISAISSLEKVAREIAAKYPGQVLYIDTEALFLATHKQGASYDDLFLDWIHPSFTGQALLGEAFYCGVASVPMVQEDGWEKSPPFALAIRDRERFDEIPRVWNMLKVRYQEKLGIPRNDIIHEYLNGAQINFAMYDLSAGGDELLDDAEKRARAFWAASEKTTQDSIDMLRILIQVKLRRKDRSELASLLNQLVSLDFDYTMRRLNSPLRAGEPLVRRQLEEMGVQFSESDRSFFLNE